MGLFAVFIFVIHTQHEFFLLIPLYMGTNLQRYCYVPDKKGKRWAMVNQKKITNFWRERGGVKCR
jgi:acyl-coenzyme A synthetase/AMP-(fatty) acid ligase